MRCRLPAPGLFFLLGSSLSIIGACRGVAGEHAAVPPLPANARALGPASAAPSPAQAGLSRVDTSLPQRKSFFANPERGNVKISPDGKLISFLAGADGNVWIAPVSAPERARALTKGPPVFDYQWAFDNVHLLIEREAGGEGKAHILSVDVKTSATRDLTPYENAAPEDIALSPARPGELAVGLGDRDPDNHDAYRIDIHTGKRTLLFENKEGLSHFIFDRGLELRVVKRELPDGSQELLARKGTDAFAPFIKVPLDDGMTTAPWTMDATGKALYLADSRGRNTAAAVAVDLSSGKASLLAEDELADVATALVHPVSGKLQAVTFVHQRAEWRAIDPSLAADFAYLRTVEDAELSVLSRSLDDARWVVSYDSPEAPERSYLYDRRARKVTPLFVQRPSLDALPLTRMNARVLQARDGLPLVSYLSLPKASDPDGDGKPNQPLPLVVFVHGGPWQRDTWGYNELHQFLASRGYAVLSVNFRGSTGFGKRFLNAGDGEWGRKMQDDLVDAVDWAVKEGVASPDKVAVLGASYGGYAALMAAATTPDRFACAVDLSGASQLATLLEDVPPSLRSEVAMLVKRMGGDPRTPEGRKYLDARSPLPLAGQIKHPLLVGQGATDPKVKQRQVDQLVAAVQSRGAPVSYALFAEDGHCLPRPENLMAFNALIEVFLAQCLAGPYQRIGDDVLGSSLAVPVGVERLPGVREAMVRAAPKSAP